MSEEKEDQVFTITSAMEDHSSYSPQLQINCFVSKDILRAAGAETHSPMSRQKMDNGGKEETGGSVRHPLPSPLAVIMCLWNTMSTHSG